MVDFFVKQIFWKIILSFFLSFFFFGCLLLFCLVLSLFFFKEKNGKKYDREGFRSRVEQPKMDPYCKKQR